MASYSLWWIEVVVALLALMGFGLGAREAGAFMSIARIRQRDGGIPNPRTPEEYLLLFPGACPRCLSRRSKRVRGWHRDVYGAAEFIDTLQCADCEYVASGRALPSRIREADATEHMVARPRWFIRRREADQIVAPSLNPPDDRERTQ